MARVPRRKPLPENAKKNYLTKTGGLPVRSLKGVQKVKTEPLREEIDENAYYNEGIIDFLEKELKQHGTALPSEPVLRFVFEYFSNGMQALKAYRKYIVSDPKDYSTKDKFDASRLLSSKAVRLIKKILLNGILENQKETLEYQIIKAQTERAFYNVKDLLNKDGELIFDDLQDIPEELNSVIDGIEKIANGKDANVFTYKVKLADKAQALKELTKYAGILPEQKMKHTFDNNGAPLGVALLPANKSVEDWNKRYAANSKEIKKYD